MQNRKVPTEWESTKGFQEAASTARRKTERATHDLYCRSVPLSRLINFTSPVHRKWCMRKHNEHDRQKKHSKTTFRRHKVASHSTLHSGRF